LKFSERIEQFDCIESEEWTVSDGAAKEYGRQDVAMTDGVRLAP
jgi:hypothetical protein